MCLPVFNTTLFLRNLVKRNYYVTYNYYSLFENRNNNKSWHLKSSITRQPLKLQQRHLSAESVRNWYTNLFKTVTESDAVAFAKDSLVLVHDVTGLHWGGTIVLTTFGLRLLLTFPLGVYQNYVMAKLELARIEMAGIVEELKKETAVAIKRFNWSKKKARRVYNLSAKNQWRRIVERDNCHPLKTSLVVFVQLPVWILLSLALRSMTYKFGQDPAVSEIIAEQLSADSIVWLPNLLLPDPTGIIPLTVCLTNLLIIEIQSCSKPNQSRLQRIMTHVFRGFALVSFPIALSVPSCMSLYWSVSSGLALAQNVALMSPKLRSTFNIPITPSHKETPYSYAWNNFKMKIPFQEIKIYDTPNDHTRIFGVLPSTQWHVFSITSRPGLILVRNPFTPKGQQYWIVKCLRDFTKKPNLRNTDIDNNLKNVYQIWDHCQSSTESLDRLRWATLGYHHNWDTKVYSEDRKSDFPEDLHALSLHFAQALGFPKFEAQAAIVNFYHPGTSLSGHVDHSEVDLNAPLLSFSFGQSAIFLIGGPSLDEEGLPILLQSGDLLVMTREARLCYHAVPRIIAAPSNPPWNLPDSTECQQCPDQRFDQELVKSLENGGFWTPFEKYVNRSRININVRQVLPEGQTSIV